MRLRLLGKSSRVVLHCNLTTKPRSLVFPGFFPLRDKSLCRELIIEVCLNALVVVVLAPVTVS